MQIQSWIDEMADYVKSLDGNHLLTVGEEGFYSGSDPTRYRFNPQGSTKISWANTEGQDFIGNHRSPSIDFASIHSWVDNWQVRNITTDPKSVNFTTYYKTLHLFKPDTI